MNHISLFSGIGGDSLAAEWAGFEHTLFCELDPFCQQVLRKHWPNVPIIGDVKDVTKEKVEQAIADSTGHGGVHLTLLVSGVPCQPASSAGKRKGKADNRWLWPQAIRVLGELKPTWAVFENPAGIGSLFEYDCEPEVDEQQYTEEEVAAFGPLMGRMCERTGKNLLVEIMDSIEAEGYEVQTVCIPACAVNAPHRRDRIFIIAHSKCVGWEKGARESLRHTQSIAKGQEFGNSSSETSLSVAHALNGEHRGGRGQGGETDSIQSKVRETLRSWMPGGTDGSDESGADTHSGEQGLEGGEPEQSLRLLGQSGRGRCYERPDWSENWIDVATCFCRMDAGVSHRVDRLKALGNAIVPQQIYPILKAIADIESGL